MPRRDGEYNDPLSRVSLLVRLTVCLVSTAVLWELMGPVGLAFASVAWGGAFAAPLLDAVGVSVRWTRRLASRENWPHGLYAYSPHHDIRYRVDEAGHPWFVDADVLAVLGKYPDPRARRLAAPHEYRELAGEGVWAYSEAGVKRLLEQSRHDEARPLALKLERDVAFQCRFKRENPGMVKK